MPHKFTHDESVAGGKSRTKSRKMAAKLEKQLAEMGLTSEVLSYLKDIVVELIRACQTNPLIGVAVSVSFMNMLYRTKLIDKAAYYIVLGIVGASAGVDILGKIEAEIPIVGSFTGGDAKTELIRPTATTITHAEGDSDNNKLTNDAASGALAALLRLAPAVAAA